QSLINAVASKEINSAQYNITRQIRNVKSAIKFLEYSIGENQKRLQEEKLQSIQAQGDVNLQNQSLIEREKQKTKSQEIEADITLLREKDKLDEMKTRRDALLKELQSVKSHERNLELKNLELQIKQEVETQK